MAFKIGIFNRLRNSRTDAMNERSHSKPLSFFLLAFLLLGGITSGCRDNAMSSGSSSSPAGAMNAKFDRQILRDFVMQVVVPSNNLFAQRASALSKAVDAYVSAPSATTLANAQSAWVKARAVWEQTECFGFGPATSLGYDGALDTWPVNETDFKGLIKSNVTLTAISVSKMKETEKGFHVIEYFLFGQDKRRQPTDLAARDLQYLQLLGKDFASVATDLATSWSKGVEGKTPYQEVFSTAGEGGNTIYPTVQAGSQEMIQGIVDSLDEVANEKLGQPLAEKNPKLAESRFSLNTLTDIKSNLQGAQNVYLGSFPDAKTSSGKNLSSYIAQVNPALDGTVKQKFKVAAQSLEQISQPLETAILNPKVTDSLKAAQSAIDELRETIEKDVKPLVVKS
jgi:putative iron-regulated protein